MLLIVSAPTTEYDPELQSDVTYIPDVGSEQMLDTVLLPKREALPATQTELTKEPVEGLEHEAVVV